MARLRFSGRYLVSASCGSYMWLSASNTGKESSRDGMAISSRKVWDSHLVVMTLPQRSRPKTASGGRPIGQLRGCPVDDGEVHCRRGEQRLFALLIGQNVDLHDHGAPTGAQHPRHRIRGAL